MTEYKKTALFDVHKRLGARIVPFGGWSMPVEYSGITKEHNAVRTAAGLFDVSHMGEFEVVGPQALDLIQYVTSNDASRLVDGQAQYSALPTPEGTVIDDLLVYRRSAERYLLVVNAGNIQTDFEWISSHNKFDTRLEDVSDTTGLLALQGPRAIEILQRAADIPLHDVLPFRFATGQVLGRDAILSRTGYTGEDGFEIFCSADDSETLWNGILELGQSSGLLPAGLGARNTLRLEATMLLCGNDMDTTTSLLEAGLGWIVKLDKPPFIGHEALRKEKAHGVQRRLVGFEMMGREIAREHYPTSIDGQAAGHVTSGSPSITLKKTIGLTYLPVQHTAVGAKFQVSIRGRECDARVVPTPFYKRS